MNYELTAEEKDLLKTKSNNPAWFGMISNQVSAAVKHSDGELAWKNAIQRQIKLALRTELTIRELSQ